MSTPKIIHRDLKPANLLLTETDNIMLCDFGISREKLTDTTTMTGFVGTVAYMAPELFKNKNYSEKVDGTLNW